MAEKRKKRILFYTENFCGERAKGGLEQATFRIARGLWETGKWEVYHAFRSKRGDGGGGSDSVYKELIKLPSNGYLFSLELGEFIERNDIDVVVNMSRFFRHKLIARATRRGNPRAKLLFMQHFAPGSERKKPTFASGWHLLKLNPLNPLYWLRATVYPLVKMPRNLRWSKVYRDTYRLSDRVILLSEGYFDDYGKIASLPEGEGSKFAAIANIFDLSKNDGHTAAFLRAKEKRVLVLSRMDEIQKRVSLALKVWKKVMENADLRDWHLDIVGEGHDMALERRVARRIGLTGYTFHGWSDPHPFLKRSAILMMTSEYEGLPLSILEAEAYATVPIAFDSYRSLADVVTDGKDGVLVRPFGDIDAFARELARLMRSADLRRRLAESAAENASRFSSAVITEKWLELLNSLDYDN